MAEFFLKFDVLPIDHSHGNLCAWRGILMLYEVTHDHRWLDRARAKWDAAMSGGFVWSLGGVGEHWFVSFGGDEGCSESDWLRFNLELWRFTGESRYLDIAERLLQNQYATNQCPNGGFGMCHLDADAAGPFAASGQLDEWPFCCSFHGPLGLHFLKSYLAVGSERGIFVNFPLNFSSGVQSGGRDWLVTVRSQPGMSGKQTLDAPRKVEIELSPRSGGSAPTTLWVRVPDWAASNSVRAGGAVVAVPCEKSYLRIRRDFKAGEKIVVTLEKAIIAEGRRFQKPKIEPGRITRLRDVTVLSGPDVLFATPTESLRPVLLATVDAAGRLGFPLASASGFATVALPGLDATDAAIALAIEHSNPVLLRPWTGAISHRREAAEFTSAVAMSDLGRGSGVPPRDLAFAVHLVVVPAESIAARIDGFARRAKQWENSLAGPFFGASLEKRPEIWLTKPGWKFTPDGLRVAGGDVGLLDGDDYRDYRLEFELVISKDGQGIAGWVVRAADMDNCQMFQLQTADSTADMPQYRTRPNTLRPHLRSGGVWEVADPVPLPRPIRRGETHKVAVECRQGTVEVFLDGQSIYKQSGLARRGGTIGFRASGPAEDATYRHITLTPLN